MARFIYSRIPEYDPSVCPFCFATVTQSCPRCGHGAWFYLVSMTAPSLSIEIRGQRSIDIELPCRSLEAVAEVNRRSIAGIELPLSLEAVCGAALSSGRFDALLASARAAEFAPVRGVALALVARAAARAGSIDQSWSAAREAVGALDAFTYEHHFKTFPYELDWDWRAFQGAYFDALCEAVGRIAAVDRPGGLRDVIEEIRRIAGVGHQSVPVVLAAMADAAAGRGQLEILLEAVRSAPHGSPRSRGLVAVAQAAARAGRADLARAAVESIGDGPSRGRAPLLSDDSVEDLGSVSIGEGPSREQALAAVAEAAAQTGRASHREPAENATDVSGPIDRFLELLEDRGIKEIEIDLRQVDLLTEVQFATLARLDHQLGPTGRLRLGEVREAPLAAFRVMGWDQDLQLLSPGQLPSRGRSITPIQRSSSRDEGAIDPCLKAILAGVSPPSDMDPSILRIESRVIGSLAIPTGSIVACDPYYLRTDAFSRLAPRGEFPVRLYIAHYHGDQRIAAAALEFGEGIPDQWEQADVVSGVDAGTSCFTDRTTAERLALICQQETSWQDDIMTREMAETDVLGTCSYAMIRVPPDSAPSLACFSSGWGDGAYASYWGLRGGEITRLVTDFGLVGRLR
jgi:Protein of unknown function (DUF4241)